MRRVRLFREHKSILKALKELIDYKKMKREAKFMVLNNEMSLKEESSASESFPSDAEANSPRKDSNRSLLNPTI